MPEALRRIIEAQIFKISMNYSTLLPADMANTKKIRHSNKKRPNRNFAMAAAPAAMPVNPNSAATIAITKKITAQRNIVSPPQNENRIKPSLCVVILRD